MREEVFLRLATKKDKDLLFLWANDPLTRTNAFSTHQISYEEHCKWFCNMLNDKEQIQFIFMQGNEPIGQIRLSVFDYENANISYSICPQKRGMGYGKLLCEIIVKEVRKNYPYIKRLCAQVKPENKVSAHCFLESGFLHTYCQYECNVID